MVDPVEDDDLPTESFLPKRKIKTIRKRDQDLLRLFQLKNTNDIVYLNVSGTKMTLSRELLTSIRGSVMQQMFEAHNDCNLKRIENSNEVFINSDPAVFM